MKKVILESKETGNIHTIAGKHNFINVIFISMYQDIQNNVHKMPKKWDGHELRRYIADKFETCANCSSTDMKDKRSKRYRDYENELIMKGL